jgi:hypothetical protein
MCLLNLQSATRRPIGGANQSLSRKTKQIRLGIIQKRDARRHAKNPRTAVDNSASTKSPRMMKENMMQMYSG